MKSLFRVALALCLGFVTVTSAKADVIIDGFGTPLSGGSVASGVLTSSGASVSSGSNSGGDILGNRLASVSSSGSGSSSMQIDSGLKNLILGTTAATTNGTYTLKYNGFGSQNLSAANSVDLNVAFYNNGGAGFITTAKLDWLDTVTGAHTSGLVNIPTTGTLSLPFGGFGRSQVTDLTLTFNLTQGADVTFGNSGVRIPGLEVPEPTSLALFGVIAVGGYVVARRRRQAA